MVDQNLVYLLLRLHVTAIPCWQSRGNWTDYKFKRTTRVIYSYIEVICCNQNIVRGIPRQSRYNSCVEFFFLEDTFGVSQQTIFVIFVLLWLNRTGTGLSDIGLSDMRRFLTLLFRSRPMPLLLLEVYPDQIIL